MLLLFWPQSPSQQDDRVGLRALLLSLWEWEEPRKVIGHEREIRGGRWKPCAQVTRKGGDPQRKNSTFTGYQVPEAGHSRFFSYLVGEEGH